MKCPECGGKGEFIEHRVGSTIIKSDCMICDDQGEVSFRKYTNLLFWKNVPVWFVEWYAERILKHE